MSASPALHRPRLTRWKYISGILSIEPAAIDLADKVPDIPSGLVGQDGFCDASTRVT